MCKENNPRASQWCSKNLYQGFGGGHVEVRA